MLDCENLRDACARYPRPISDDGSSDITTAYARAVVRWRSIYLLVFSEQRPYNSEELLRPLESVYGPGTVPFLTGNGWCSCALESVLDAGFYLQGRVLSPLEIYWDASDEQLERDSAARWKALRGKALRAALTDFAFKGWEFERVRRMLEVEFAHAFPSLRRLRENERPTRRGAVVLTLREPPPAWKMAGLAVQRAFQDSPDLGSPVKGKALSRAAYEAAREHYTSDFTFPSFETFRAYWRKWRAWDDAREAREDRGAMD